MPRIQENGSITSQKRIRQHLREQAKEQAKKEAEKVKRALQQAKKEESSNKLALQGRRKATERVLRRMKSELCLKKEDTHNLRILYDYYKSSGSMNRSDWLNCTAMLGLSDGVSITKTDLEMFFQDITKERVSKIDFKQFCSVMGIVSERTHPKKDESEDNSITRCLERLLADLMTEPDDKNRKCQNLCLEEEKAKRKTKKETKKRREKETEVGKKQVTLTKVEKARKEAIKRIAKKRKGKFTISAKDSENLRVLYNYYHISPSRMMKRADWLNCVSALAIQDDQVIQKLDCEEIFEKICLDKTHGIDIDQFGVGFALLAMRKYKRLNQTKALARLMHNLITE